CDLSPGVIDGRMMEHYAVIDISRKESLSYVAGATGNVLRDVKVPENLIPCTVVRRFGVVRMHDWA
ncbi:MAG: hypothetical protein QM605_13085, partial [Sphingobium sp.]